MEFTFESKRDATDPMVCGNVDHLPAVGRKEPSHVVGIITRGASARCPHAETE
jgi:hypothetical protein